MEKVEGSRLLIKLDRFPPHIIAEGRMKLRTKIHSVTENRAEFVGKGKITQTHPSKSTGGKFCEHVDIASLRVEIAA